MEKQFYMKWREDFNDQEGWFARDELNEEIQRIRDLNGDGESGVLLVIQGREVQSPELNEKLVRDNMPALCETTPGLTKMTYRIASLNEYRERLMDKLIEEVYEVMSEFVYWNRKPLDRSKHKLIEELADLKEVFEAIGISLDIDHNIIRAQAEKFSKKGGFSRGFIWDGKK